MPATFKFKPSLDQINEMFNNTMGETLGIKFIEIGDDFLKATMPVDHRTKQPFGLLHGGASAALAETLGSYGSQLFMDQSNSFSVGLEINANHLKSVNSGQVTGTARPIRIGRTVHVWSIEIHNEANELICVSRLTVMVISK